MKKFLLFWFLFLASITLIWCQKNSWTESKYPVAEQVCLDNGWEVTVDWEWIDICLLWSRWINLADMEEKSEDEEYDVDLGTSELFSKDSLEAAVLNIMNEFYQWDIKVDVKSLAYLWDEKAISELDYCKSLDESIDECVVFTSNFHTSEDSGVLEPNTDINDYTWYLGRQTNWDWIILTRGFN